MPPGATAPQEIPPGPTLPAAAERETAGLATVLAAVALALAVVAVAVAFVEPGRVGAAGAPGPSPVPTVAYFAVVGSNGSLARDSGVASSAIVGTGHYRVTFLTILYSCSFQATLGTTSDGSQAAGSAEVVAPPATGNAVNVTTVNATGVATNASFHLVAACPAGLYAVVGGNGSFESGAGVELTGNLGPGRYEVVFDQDVEGCAYLAGLGTSFSGPAPSGSATVAQLAGHPNGVWVNTYAADGTLVNATFHLTAYC